MKTKFYFLTLLILISKSSFSENTKKEAEELKKRTLLVELIKYDKDTALENKLNLTLRNAVQKYWHFNDKVIFCTHDEVKKYASEKSDGYGILRCDRNVQRCTGGFGSQIHPLKSFAVIFSEEMNKDERANKNYVSSFQLPLTFDEAYGDEHSTYVAFAHDPPSFGDIAFCVCSIERNLEGILKGENYAIYDELQKQKIAADQKTLIIKRSLLNKSFTEDVVKKYIHTKYELVTDDAYNEKLSKQEENNIFLIELKGYTTLVTSCWTYEGAKYFLLDSTDGRIVGMFPESTNKLRYGYAITKGKFEDLISHLLEK
jgi:hypothetical protein